MSAQRVSSPNATRIVEYQMGASLLRSIERPLQRCQQSDVRRFAGYEEIAAGPVARTESASADVVLIFELAPALRIAERDRYVRHNDGFIAGLGDAPTRTLHDGYQSGVQVNLSALAARRLLGFPLAEIAHRNVAIADVLSPEQRVRLRELHDAETWDARLTSADTLLALTATRPAPSCLRALAWVIERIECSAGAVRIAALARELGWSDRRLQRTFSEQIGIAPKLFARLVRFDALMNRMRVAPDVSWADAAIDLGYFDQSHLVRDVRQFTGSAPTQVDLQQMQFGAQASASS